MPASVPDDVPTLTDLASLDADAADELADTNELTLPDTVAPAAQAPAQDEEDEGDTVRGAIPEELRSSRPDGSIADLVPSTPVLVHPKSLMPSSIAPVAVDLSHSPLEDDEEDTATLRTEIPRPSTSSPILVDAPRPIPRGRANTGTQRDPLLAIVPHATSHARAYAIAASLAAVAVLAVGVFELLALRTPTGSVSGAGAAPRVAEVLAAREVVIGGAAEKDKVEAVPTGTLRFAPSTKGALVDGRPTRVPDGGALVLPCGRHTIKVGGSPHVTLDVPCGGIRTF
jgi:hypothetical protein